MSTILPQTMLRWSLDSNNTRTAVQTKDGILQVKSQVGGKIVSDQKYTTYNYLTQQHEQTPAPSWWNGRPKMEKFTDFMAWHASLPSGGKVTIEPPHPSRINKMRPLMGETDAKKMYHLVQRFQIHDPKYNYKQKAMLVVGEDVKSVWCEAIWLSEEKDYECHIRVYGSDTRYKTFAEIGDCLNAADKPKMTVFYRKNSFPVANLF